MTKAPLDFETKDTYTVVITADDGSKESNATDQITVTIEVKDLDEKPTLTSKAGGLAILGPSSSSVAEGSTGTVATYTAEGATLSLAGADSSDFNFSGGALSFKNIPNFEAPADADDNNTYMVTVMAADGDRRVERAVTVSVTDVDELGRLSGQATASHMENSTDDVGTYTASGGSMSDVANWSLMGDDMGDLSISTSGVLTFDAPPNYEMPVDEGMDNTYMVTVKAEAGGEMKMMPVTVTVTNVEELGTLTADMDSPISYAENTMDTVATYTASGSMADTATWTLEGTDASDFDITGGVLTFNAAPDYENPMGGANNDSNTYMVTVKASAGGEMEMMEVTIMVTDEEETGSVSLSPESPVVGSPVTATLTDSDGRITGLTWIWETSSDMATWSAATGTVTSEGTTSTYTSVDDDVDDYLRATASYTDSYGSGNSVTSGSAKVVAANVAPAFPSATETRSIAENTAANTNIGDPVAATDPNGDTLTYTLGGTNAASFGIVGSTGQLLTSAALDFETKSTYSVEVTATDLGGLSDTIDVTINVTDVVEVVPAIVQTYDTNNDGDISITELFVAIDDYFDGGISIPELFEVIDAYFG